MYLAHYELDEKPFQLTSDPKFLWTGEMHQEALSILEYGVQENKGFLLLTGEVGTGKTVLINALVERLSLKTIVATVPDPDLESLDFYNFLAEGFQFNKTYTSKGNFLLDLKKFLLKQHATNNKVLLIIDESQRLNSDLLEEIRLLSNIELNDRKLINIFFVGQDEFNETLNLHRNRAVTQRISIRYTLGPLSETETGDYIKHRLSVAGAKGKIFKPSAFTEIYSFSGGIPRNINRVCDNALLTGYAIGKKVIDARIVKECARELEIPKLIRPVAEEAQGPSSTPASTETTGGSKTGAKGSARPVSGASADAAESGDGKPGPADGSGEQARPASRVFRFLVLSSAAAIILVLLAVFMFTRAPLVEEPEWKMEDLAPTKYKNTLAEEGQNLKKQLTNQKPATPPADGADTTEITDSAPSDKPAPETPSETEAGVGIGISASANSTPETEAAENSEPREEQGDGAAESSPAQTEPAYTSAEKPAETMSQRPAPTEPKAAPSEPAMPAPVQQEAETTADEAEPSEPFDQAKLIVPFDYDSNEIPEDSFVTLEKLATYLVKHPEIKIAVKGYSDAIGALAYNKKISEFRALTVKSFLVGKGADPKNIETLGIGPENPIASNDTIEGRKQNRRIEIEFR